MDMCSPRNTGLVQEVVFAPCPDHNTKESRDFPTSPPAKGLPAAHVGSPRPVAATNTFTLMLLHQHYLLSSSSFQSQACAVCMTASLVENTNATCPCCRLPGRLGHSLLGGDDVHMQALIPLCLHTGIGFQLIPQETRAHFGEMGATPTLSHPRKQTGSDGQQPLTSKHFSKLC